MTIDALFGLRGKKAIVTGGANGLGKAMAEALAEAGAKVAVLDIEVPHSLEGVNENIWYFGVDLSDRSELRYGYSAVFEEMGRIDILVNSAGIQRRSPAEKFSDKDWDDVLELNLTATKTMCQLAGRHMLERGSGKIINMASMTSFTGGYNVIAYAAGKGAVAQLTKSLANEWGGGGVNVNAIAPGFMDTDMNKALIADPERNGKILGRIAAGRLGTPEDLKGPVVFLASPASNYLHGTILTVDGGYLCS